MKRLNHKTLIESGYTGFIQSDAPERVLQFGEGNFLRAFVYDDFSMQYGKNQYINDKIAQIFPAKKKHIMQIAHE